LTRMESSRQKGIFRATALQQLIKIAQGYMAEPSEEDEEEEGSEEQTPLAAKAVVVKSEKAATPANC